MLNAKRVSLWAALLGLAASTLFADQVTLKNGDRFTGAIVKKDAKALTIKADTYGKITVPWDDVQSLSTDKPIHAELTNGQKVTGAITMRGNTILLGNREVSLADIAVLRDDAEQADYDRLLSPGWGEVWAGAATLGFAGTKGNAETSTLTVGLNAARVTNFDKTLVYFNAIKASALIGGVDAGTAQAVRGGLGYARNLNPRVFVNVFNDYEYDRFQNLDLRFVLGGGLGYIAWKTERGRLDILGGFAYNRESFSAEPDPRNSAEAYLGDDFTYKLNSVTSMYQNMRFFPNLSNTGEYRMNFDVGANTRLLEWLTWNIALSDRYLSNPVRGRNNNDMLYTTGIGVTFSR
jgi:putative salt-induced outer membrane protein YdiY